MSFSEEILRWISAHKFIITINLKMLNAWKMMLTLLLSHEEENDFASCWVVFGNSSCLWTFFFKTSNWLCFIAQLFTFLDTLDYFHLCMPKMSSRGLQPTWSIKDIYSKVVDNRDNGLEDWYVPWCWDGEISKMYTCPRTSGFKDHLSVPMHNLSVLQ